LTSEVNIISAFVAGLVSFFSPCVLPLIPAYIAYIGGNAAEKVNRSLLLSRVLLFILGFTLVFVMLGATASFFGRFLHQYLQMVIIVSSGLIIIFGLHMLGILRVTLFNKDTRFQLKSSGSIFMPLLLGMAFAFGWSPCVGPVLASILLLASMEQSLIRGMFLLFVYSMGLGLPFFITALAAEKILKIFKKMNNSAIWIERTAGIVLVLFGFWLFYTNII